MRDRLASETEEERAARLQRMSANQRHRLAAETEEERTARLALQQMSANQHHRLAAETGSEREARLQRNREGQRGQQPQLPLFEQPSVQAKMVMLQAAPHQRSARACASIAFELTLAPAMLCIPPVITFRC